MLLTQTSRAPSFKRYYQKICPRIFWHLSLCSLLHFSLVLLFSLFYCSSVFSLNSLLSSISVVSDSVLLGSFGWLILRIYILKFWSRLILLDWSITVRPNESQTFALPMNWIMQNTLLGPAAIHDNSWGTISPHFVFHVVCWFCYPSSFIFIKHKYFYPVSVQNLSLHYLLENTIEWYVLSSWDL